MELTKYYKRYNTIDLYYKEKYNSKIAKIALNANFSCPNKDGKKGYGGCTYCSKLGSGDTAGDKNHTLTEQFYEIKKIMDKKWPNLKYIAYLQANSNTYASLDKLKSVYEEILSIDSENIIALDIATRPDCFTEEIYNYLEQLNQKKKIIIELGLQTSNEITGKLINRCSTNKEFITAVYELKKRNIEVVAHIINGLPYETKEDMLNTIGFINDLPIDGIKFHSLLILKDTKIHQQYLQQNFKILTLEEYVEICCQQIAHLRPDILIHRLSADAKKEDIFMPEWPLKKLIVMNEIDKYLKQNNLYQGIYYKKGEKLD